MNLADFITDNMERILAEWEAFAATLTPAATHMTSHALRDHAQQVLQAVAIDLRTQQSPQEQTLKSKGDARPSVSDAAVTAAETHGALRSRSGFEITQMVAEYRALRTSVLSLWMEGEADSKRQVQDIIRFNEAIDQALAESVAYFNAEVERTRDLLVGMLGHDLRTPLQSIQLTSQLLSRLDVGTDVARAVARLDRSCTRIKALLDGVVDFTRFRLGLGVRIHVSDIDLAGLVREELEQLGVANPGRDMRLATEGDTRGRWDGARLQQVLANLVSNAIKHGAPDSPVDVSISGREDHVVFAVRNVGRAIDPDELRRIFEPLHRGESSNTSEGLGLGLFITRELVTAHGGEVTARSDARETVFSVKLPRDAGRENR